MDKEYSEIREAFEICSVVIAKGGVSLIFHSDDNTRATVSIDNEDFHNLHVFTELVSQAQEIKITLDPAGKGEMQFCFPNPVETTLLFSPLRHTKTNEEWRKEIEDELSHREPTEAFLNAFRDKDVTDPEQVISAISEFLESEDDKAVYTIEGIKAWWNLKKEGELLSEKWKSASVEVEPPDDYTNFGDLRFWVDSDHRKTFLLPQDVKDQFLNVTRASDAIMIESARVEGKAIFTIAFYS